MRRTSVLAGLLLVVVACGSRGPLDDTPVGVDGTDGGSSGAIGPGSSGGPGGPGSSGGPTGRPGTGPGGVDPGRPTRPIPDAGVPGTGDGGRPNPIACGSCVFSQCGQTALQCVQSTSCRTVFQCVATTCLSGGLNPQCLFKCAGSDPSGALAALSVFTCVTNSCGSDCASVIGGLGGLGGGGGFGGGGGKREERGERDEKAFEQVFSPWPELLTPVDQETR